MKYPKSLLSSLGALALSLALSHTAYAGFGITPPYVYNDRLSPGSTYTQEILLVRSDPVDDLKAEITINTPGIEDWFTIDRGEEFLLPAGVAKVPIEVTVEVPEDAEFTRHQGNIRIRTVPPTLGSGVSIALGAQIDVDIRVVDEILDFEVRRVQIEEAEEPRRFLWLDYPGKITFLTTINNTGNAPVAPSRIEFDIYDKRGTTLLESTTHTNRLKRIEPFETGEVVAELPTLLPAGSYLVKYRIFHYEDDVKREGELTLSILPAGTLENYAGYGFSGLSLGDKATIVVPLLVLVLIALGALGYFFLGLGRRDPGRRGKHRESSRRRDGPDDDGESAANARRPGRAGFVAPRRDRSRGTESPERRSRQAREVVDLSGRRRDR